MNETGKNVVALGIIGAIGYGVYKLVKGPAAPAGGAGYVPAGEVRLTIVPAGAVGMRVGSLPASVVEGSLGNMAVISITNNSVYAGTTVKAPYTFGIRMRMQTGASLPSDVFLITEAMACLAGETKTRGVMFSVPFGMIGPLRCDATLFKTDGVSILADATPVFVPITYSGITPGGTITW